MIRTEDLRKEYGNFKAVNGISLNIKPGEIYGFLGPNGAGKTSTIKMLLGINKPTSGRIYLLNEGLDPSNIEARRKIGVVPEKHPIGVWTWMTAYEYLEFFAGIYNVGGARKRINGLMEKVDLYRFRNRPYKSFSRGMLQKLNIIRALLPDPDILFLDEPISGLDPIGVKLVRDMIVSENREGRSIFISSHLLSEVEKICHRIGIIYRGRLVAEDDMGTLLGQLAKEREVQIDVEDCPSSLAGEISGLRFVRECRREKDTLFISVDSVQDYRRDLSSFIFSKGHVPIRIELKSASLEDAFMTITKENIDKITATATEGGTP